MADLIGLMVGLLLTVMVFSYLLGDNPLSRSMYRTALHVFIGAASGYALAVAWWNVLEPRLVGPVTEILDGRAGLDPATLAVRFIPHLLALLLLFKIFRSPVAQIGNISMAYLVGVGAAVAVGGAVTGTLLPQVAAAGASSGVPLAEIFNVERLTDAAVFFVGTISVLLYFLFSARRGSGGPERPVPFNYVAAVGQVFINIAYGALFAGAIAASLAVLGERLTFVREAIGRFGFGG